jgi:hypothetical protein
MLAVSFGPAVSEMPRHTAAGMLTRVGFVPMANCW